MNTTMRTAGRVVVLLVALAPAVVRAGMDIPGSPAGTAVAMSGSGRVVLVYGGGAGDGRRLYARGFDGAAWAEMNGSLPVDAGLPGCTGSPSLAFTAPAAGLLAFTNTQRDSTSIRVAGFAGALWTVGNGGGPLSDPGLGDASAPAVASWGNGSAVVAYVQETLGTPRLYASAWNGVRWHRLNGGDPLDRDDLGASGSPSVTVASSGTVVVTYCQEGEDGAVRLYAVAWDGTSIARANGGEPVEDYPAGTVADEPGNCADDPQGCDDTAPLPDDAAGDPPEILALGDVS